MKVDLTYFKPNGEFYTRADYVTAKETLAEIWAEVTEMMRKARLPGLMPGHSPFIVSVRCPGHVSDHPWLIVPDSALYRGATHLDVPDAQVLRGLKLLADHFNHDGHDWRANPTWDADIAAANMWILANA